MRFIARHGRFLGNSVSINGNSAHIDVSTRKFPSAVAVVDREDLPRLITGNRRWYAMRVNQNKVYVTRSIGTTARDFIHRIILGVSDPRIQIDHRSGNTFNNRKANLRIATPNGNRANSKKNCNNTSGYRGVSKVRNRGKWQVQIKVKQQSIYLGQFNSLTAAARAYDAAARKYFGQYARTNF